MPSTSPTTSRAAIIGGSRIPFARAHREYADSTNQEMLTAALNGLSSRFSLVDEHLGLVAGGAVMKHSRDFNLTREAVLGSALAPSTPAVDMQLACATSLAATVHVADAISAGRFSAGIAGGTDSISDAPLALSDALRRTLIRLSASRTMKGKLALIGSVRPGDLAPAKPGGGEPRTGLTMGEHAARTAREMGVGREEQDELALASHRNLARAYEEGFFSASDLVVPFAGVERDTNLRPDSSLEKLARLEPVFGVSDAQEYGVEATMTAGNSTPLTDGAAAVLLASDTWAQARGLEPQAWLVDSEVAAVDFVHGPDGLLMAPTHAVPHLLERNGLKLQDFDFYEIHEAFASQVLATLKVWESDQLSRELLGCDRGLGPIDRTKLNVKGSSLAAGHPFAATGARIVATAAQTLADNGGGRALISVCAAGGQGVAAILER